MTVESHCKALKTHHAGAGHSPVQLVLFDVHSDELDVVQVVGEQGGRV